MHSLPLPLVLSALSLAATSAFASPTPLVVPSRRSDGTRGFEVPLYRRNPKKRSGDELAEWLSRARINAHAKYGKPLPPSSISAAKAKRASGGAVQLYDISTDAEYVGTVLVGEPATAHVVIMDTGSADLWLAGDRCATGCSGVPLYDPTKSSTSQTSSTEFQVIYGSGAAQGVLVKDTVGIAGLNQQGQIFGMADEVSADMLQGSISGLLGLGWDSIASSRATPVVQALWEAGQLTQPVMSFALTRFIDDSRASSLAPGGIMTVGETNSSLYTGNINYVNLKSKTYWLIGLDGVTSQSSAAAVTGTSAAIDTGTSLVGAPPQDVAAIYSHIQGAAPSSDPRYEGYWTFPCSANPSVALTFGGVSYPFNSDDFNLGRISSSECVGAIFELQESQGTPPWIVGDAWLKSVVSFYQFSPAAVGFAAPNEDTRQALEDDTAATKGFGSVTGTARGTTPSGTSGGDGGGIGNAAHASGVPVTLSLVAVLSAAFALLA